MKLAPEERRWVDVIVREFYKRRYTEECRAAKESLDTLIWVVGGGIAILVLILMAVPYIHLMPIIGLIIGGFGLIALLYYIVWVHPYKGVKFRRVKRILEYLEQTELREEEEILLRQILTALENQDNSLPTLVYKAGRYRTLRKLPLIRDLRKIAKKE